MNVTALSQTMGSIASISPDHVLSQLWEQAFMELQSKSHLTYHSKPTRIVEPQTSWSMTPLFWAFIFLFLFRYVRVVVNTIGYLKCKPVPIPEKPSFLPSDVTVIIPTIDISSETFLECVRSILRHEVDQLLISTVNTMKGFEEEKQKFEHAIPDPRARLIIGHKISKRAQIAIAMAAVHTKITIFCDNHSFWPDKVNFLPSLLAPFEKQSIGAVGNILEGRHFGHSIFDKSCKGFWNFMGCTYLSRRAMEMLANNTIDGGISCLTGRFSVWRSEIYKDEEFLNAYLNEYLFWGKVGPLNADDDKFHTRWLVKKGWDVKIQSGPDSVMETELGEYPRFMNQCLRWTRTTWRSNPRALFSERAVWYRHPWCVYSVYIYSFFRFAFFLDIATGYILWLLVRETSYSMEAMIAFFLWTFVTKMIKVMPHFYRYPKDMVYIPPYILFCCYSSFVKLYAFFTCWNTYWALAKAGGQNGLADTESNTFLGRIYTLLAGAMYPAPLMLRSAWEVLKFTARCGSSAVEELVSERKPTGEMSVEEYTSTPCACLPKQFHRLTQWDELMPGHPPLDLGPGSWLQE